MKELVLPNKFLLSIKIPIASCLLLKYCIIFLGTSLMTQPRLPNLSFFKLPFFTTLYNILGYKLEIILQVFIGIRFHQSVANKLSTVYDLIYLVIMAFSALAVQYYFIVLTSVFLNIMPYNYFKYSVLISENLAPKFSYLFSLELYSSNLQQILLATIIYYLQRNKKNKVHYFLKIAGFSFVCKILLSIQFKKYPLNPIYCLGNFMIGFTASEAMFPFNTDQLSLENQRIAQYDNVYRKYLNRLTSSRFNNIWLCCFLILPFTFSLSYQCLQGQVIIILDSISEVITAILYSTILCFRVAYKEDEQISQLFRVLREIDRSIFLVQQPLYSYLIRKFKLVQLGPYNHMIYLMLYTGVIFTTVLTGCFLGWLFDDVLLKVHKNIIQKVYLEKKQESINFKLMNQQQFIQ